MKIFPLFLLLALMGCGNNQPPNRIRIHGEFPIVKGSGVRLAFNRDDKRKVVKTEIKDGKFDFYLDSAVTGEYSFSINWPVPERKRYRVYKDNEGRVVREKFQKGVMTRFSLSKSLYINPAQATDYHIQPENKITLKMIAEFTPADYDRPDRFRLQLTTESEDARYFDKLDSMYTYFSHMNVHLISDSLRKHMAPLPQGHNALRILASKINKKQNYQVYFKARRDLARKHLNNPIAALDILSVSNDQLLKNAALYEELLDKMAGRAKASTYYTAARLKIAGIRNPIEVGDAFNWPEGEDPGGNEFRFERNGYRYMLVEFWASWCGPCRERNPIWSRLLSRYGDQGFHILGVSLDRDTGSWKAAISDDGISEWSHVTDLRGFKGVNALKYGIQAIPSNILVNGEGYVVGRDVKPDELEKLLHDAIRQN